MDQSEYSKDVSIDIDSLELEWLRQPSLYMKYAEKAARADQRVKSLKQKLIVLKATIWQREVLKAEKKPTDKQLDAFVESDPEYEKLSDEIISATYESDIFYSAVKAMDHKKSSLENEVKLWQGGYFSGPKEPHNTEGMTVKARALDAAQAGQRSRLRSSMKEKE